MDILEILMWVGGIVALLVIGLVVGGGLIASEIDLWTKEKPRKTEEDEQ